MKTSRAVLIFLITSTTRWQFGAYAYTTETQKAAKISQLGTLYPHKINDDPSAINLIQLQIYITIFPPNGKAPLHSHKNQQQPKIPIFALRKG